MSLHVFANIVTPFGTAANNRGETDGNITSLQKLVWMGQSHTTVSAEAIRFALRRLLGEQEETNRYWNEATRVNEWRDWDFKGWATPDGETYIDDDLLGFMTAEAAKAEAEESGEAATTEPAAAADAGKGKKKEKKPKGTINVRRAVLEVSRAVSLTPWSGDVTFNAASPGATPSASKGDDRGKNPVPYGTELHATRYQFGLALTPERLRDKSRAGKAINALAGLNTVAGNHGRFLFDFAPEAIILRLTDDPAPRLLYCFDTTDDGKTVNAQRLLERIESEDVLPSELILGVSDLNNELAQSFKAKGITVAGVKAALAKAKETIDAKLRS